MIMLKGYKYRIYLNKSQQEIIQKTFGCCRFVYNKTLEYRILLYKEYGESMNKISCGNYVTRVLKKDFPWLLDVDKFALINSVYNMDNAYNKFFRECAGYPKFKSKKENKRSYKTNSTNGNISISFDDNKIKLPKLQWIKASIHRKFVGSIKSATVSQLPSGKYFVSLLVETNQEKIESTGEVVGIDLGIKYLLITSNGDKFDNPKTIMKYEKKLAKAQHNLSNKIIGSKNYEKQRRKVAVIYEKIHNTRIDYLHKISHKLVDDNQVIVSEDLAVSNMVKNHKLSKSIYDCSWYELTRQLSYKSEWNDRRYIKIGRYVASSQMCSRCGYINADVKNLSIRQWNCPRCGIQHDRDINAAKNILNEGLKILSSSF